MDSSSNKQVARLTDSDNSEDEYKMVIHYLNPNTPSPGFNRRTLCCCNDQVRVEGQGAIILAASAQGEGAGLREHVDEEVLSRATALDHSASFVIGEVRRRMYTSILTEMKVSDQDLKTDFGQVLVNRGWQTEDTNQVVNSDGSWDTIVSDKLNCDPSVLRSVVMTLHYVQVTASWLNSRRNDDHSTTAHPITPQIKEVGPFIEFCNIEAEIYYVSRRVIYLANQVVEEEAASALYVMLKGLGGPLTPFAISEIE